MVPPRTIQRSIKRQPTRGLQHEWWIIPGMGVLAFSKTIVIDLNLVDDDYILKVRPMMRWKFDADISTHESSSIHSYLVH